MNTREQAAEKRSRANRPGDPPAGLDQHPLVDGEFAVHGSIDAPSENEKVLPSCDPMLRIPVSIVCRSKSLPRLS